MKSRIYLLLLVFLNIMYWSESFGQVDTKIYYEFRHRISEPFQINDSVFILSVNNDIILERYSFSVVNFDTNGNYAVFKTIAAKDSLLLGNINTFIDKSNNIYLLGWRGYQDINHSLSYFLKLSPNGQVISKKYYKAEGYDLSIYNAIYDTFSNSIIAVGVFIDKNQKLHGFLWRLDSMGNIINSTQFPETYQYIQILEKNKAILLTGTDVLNTIDSVNYSAAAVIRHINYYNFKTNWLHPTYYRDLNSSFGYNSYYNNKNEIYFNTDYFGNFNNNTGCNGHLLKIDTMGKLIKSIPITSNDSTKIAYTGFLINDSTLFQLALYLYKPFGEYDTKSDIMILKLNENILNQFLWDSSYESAGYQFTTLISNKTILVSGLLSSKGGYHPLTLLKFDLNLNRIPFDINAAPVNFFPNQKMGDTIYIDGGTDTVLIEYDIKLGLQEKVIVNKNDYLLYPNPTQEQIVVDNVNHLPFQVEVYDILGKKIEPQTPLSNKYTFNTSAYPNGIYFVKVQNSNGLITTLKFVVEK